jgi:hypothetical protein
MFTTVAPEVLTRGFSIDPALHYNLYRGQYKPVSVDRKLWLVRTTGAVFFS